MGRQSSTSAASAISTPQLPDSEYSTSGNHRHGRAQSMSRGVMIYGIVQYDFNAERPDELDAKAGETIIVIAQSNPEWFVAKPIGRLGAPGLIPVSFIKIKDVVTGATIPDVQVAMQAAGIPKVEEWKNLRADYSTNGSITLGRFDIAPQQQRQLLAYHQQTQSQGGYPPQ